MVNELVEFTQLGGTAFTVVAFLFYLRKKDELDKGTQDGFDEIIKNHLNHSNKVIKENSGALKKVAVNMKELSILVRRANRK